MGESARRCRIDESPLGAPLYMVSFGDMITIMLTFFILLCSYSKERQAGFVSDGIGSFKNVVNAHGLPGVLPGTKYPVDLGAKRARYRPVGAVNDRFLTEPDGRLTDLNRDSLRDVVKQSLLDADDSRVPLQLLFDRRETALSDAHAETLAVVADVVRGYDVTVRIEGFAYEEGVDSRATREIAAGRALSAARFLMDRAGLPERSIEVVGWGSGGAGAERHEERIQQDRLGRRLVTLYFVPPEN